MTNDSLGGEISQLALRVENARNRMVYQFDPALTDALSEDELRAERELAERIREQERDQRWKHVQAAAEASDQARATSQKIAKADMRDLLTARKALAAQRRESSPHAKLASLYKHRAWSQRALAFVVICGMLWSAVNVQHNIAPGGASDPLYWFSYLLEAMISLCLVIVMIGNNKIAEWGVLDNRRRVVIAEMSLLSLTVGLNTYPYLRSGDWYDVGVHAVAPVMIGVALLIHDAASAGYGLAIVRATLQVQDLPDPSEHIRRTMAPPQFMNFMRAQAGPPQSTAEVMRPQAALKAAEPTVEATATRVSDVEATEVAEVSDLGKSDSTFRSTGFGAGLGSSTNGSGKRKSAKPSESDSDSSGSTDENGAQYDTGQFRIAESLEQELAEMRAERRRARAKKQRTSVTADD
ncbi:hypothetical protein [Nocardia stercoris]|uniref:Uncharacterized protein n=1 Tax=Nocardia stercoris TaxID=2483361 RepID=A0A3M2LCT4_9NOCA|nr:hypothetical protein [Nocardia stercoris]RMI35292.1 hypothetical protein EBN03_03120 [Nocardia stercoris]